MEQLQPILDLFGGSQGRLAQICACMLAFQTAAKFVNAWLQKQAEYALGRIIDTEDAADDQAAMRVLQSYGYRRFAFMVDLFFRVKLPLKLPPKPVQPNAGQQT